MKKEHNSKGSDLEQAHNVVVVNWLMRSQTSYSPTAKWLKTHRFVSAQKDYILSLGWSSQTIYLFSVCSRNTTLGTLTDPVSCYLDYTCSTVDCCIDVNQVGRTMTASLSVDNCHQKMTLQLERLTKEISLLNYTWGRSPPSIFNPLIFNQEKEGDSIYHWRDNILFYLSLHWLPI